MSKSSQYAASFMDTVLIIVGLALVGILGWNTVRIGDMVTQTERNKAHLCWIMDTVFGPPDGDPVAACEEVRDFAVEQWEEAQ